MVFTPVRAASKSRRRRDGSRRLPLVLEGIEVTDGVAPRGAEPRAA